MKYQDEYRNPDLASLQIRAIRKDAASLVQPVTFMEVCGTHTMAIHQHGIRSMMPNNVKLISGPGCPVCVTPIHFVDHAVALAKRADTIITTFGDMVRVPGSSSSLLHEQASGAQIKIVYSPLDAVDIAEKCPKQTIVFLGVGFETTAPTVAAALVTAVRKKLNNFFILSAHKTMPAPMAALAGDPHLKVSGYLCPAHVSAIIGAKAYQPVANSHHVPCVITGFEPLDILQGILMLLRQNLKSLAQVEIQYRRVVKPEGNRKAREILDAVFEPCDSFWRGIGNIPGSGLKLRPAYASYDAALQLPVDIEKPVEHFGCQCGEILKGIRQPKECPLFGKQCTPETPVGACMVSSEGSCAAAYKYDD